MDTDGHPPYHTTERTHELVSRSSELRYRETSQPVLENNRKYLSTATAGIATGQIEIFFDSCDGEMRTSFEIFSMPLLLGYIMAYHGIST